MYSTEHKTNHIITIIFSILHAAIKVEDFRLDCAGRSTGVPSGRGSNPKESGYKAVYRNSGDALFNRDSIFTVGRRYIGYKRQLCQRRRDSLDDSVSARNVKLPKLFSAEVRS
jgi:hypothetical protein